MTHMTYIHLDISFTYYTVHMYTVYLHHVSEISRGSSHFFFWTNSPTSRLFQRPSDYRAELSCTWPTATAAEVRWHVFGRSLRFINHHDLLIIPWRQRDIGGAHPLHSHYSFDTFHGFRCFFLKSNWDKNEVKLLYQVSIKFNDLVFQVSETVRESFYFWGNSSLAK